MKMTKFIKLNFNEEPYPTYLNVEHIIFIHKTLDGKYFHIIYLDAINNGFTLEVDKNKNAIEQLKQYGVLL